MEPTNNTRAGAVPIGVVDGRETALGSLPARTDVEFWSFGLPAKRFGFVDFYRTHDAPSSPLPFLLSVSQVNDENGRSLSSAVGTGTYFLGAILPAGNYEIATFSNVFFGPIDRYFLDVNAMGLPPAPTQLLTEVEPNPFEGRSHLRGPRRGGLLHLRSVLPRRAELHGGHPRHPRRARGPRAHGRAARSGDRVRAGASPPASYYVSVPVARRVGYGNR